jgi:hypothetical protein
MKEQFDAKYINHAAIVGYALSRALLAKLDGGQLRGEAARAALDYLPAKPSGDMPTDLKIWLAAEAELKKLGGVG